MEEPKALLVVEPQQRLPPVQERVKHPHLMPVRQQHSRDDRPQIPCSPRHQHAHPCTLPARRSSPACSYSDNSPMSSQYSRMGNVATCPPHLKITHLNSTH